MDDQNTNTNMFAFNRCQVLLAIPFISAFIRKRYLTVNCEAVYGFVFGSLVYTLIMYLEH